MHILKNSDVTNPCISVVIPAYNVEKYLDESLRSIEQQTIKNIEIIVVDDGSTDNTQQVLLLHAQNDKRITAVTQENGGQGAARNVGAGLAKGKYIYFMDSDDFMDADALENLYNAAEEKQLDMLLFDGVTFYESEQLREELESYRDYYCRKGDYSGVYSGADLFSKMVENNEYRVSVCLQLINRQYFLNKKLSFLEGVLYEDNPYSFSAILQASRITHTKKQYFHRRIRNDSTVTKKKSFAHSYGYFYAFCDMYKKMNSCELTPEQLEHAEDIVSRMLHNARKEYGELNIEEQNKYLTLPQKEKWLFNTAVIKFDELTVKLQIVHQEKNELNEKLKRTYAEKSELNAKLQQTYAEKSELNARLQQTYAEKSELNAKLQQTYAEKSELNEKLKRTYAEKSDLNAKLQQTYAEKFERGQIIKEQKQRISELRVQVEQLRRKQ